MDSGFLPYIGAVLAFAWGTAHLFPTRSIVREFGEISADNRRIITMEWITEGVALIFIGILITAVTSVDPGSRVTQTVYWTTFACLNVLSVVSLFTGFRNSFPAFKLCPFVFTGASLLIIAGV